VKRQESSTGLHLDDGAIVDALAGGDEQVFARLVDQWGGMMLRIAIAHAHNRAVAEEVVQEAWLTVLRSLGRFERRSSLRTWVLGIVINVARSRARAERRMQPLPDDERAVDQARFLPADHPRWPHHWATEPVAWRTPEDELLEGETRQVMLAAVEALPDSQREVLVLREFNGLPAADVCSILGITDTHQRVLLHRARSRVRAALERHLAAPTETT